jgi:hypothetical protein
MHSNRPVITIPATPLGNLFGALITIPKDRPLTIDNRMK